MGKKGRRRQQQKGSSASKNTGDTTAQRTAHQFRRSTFKSLGPSRIVEEIGKGKDLPTLACISLDGENTSDSLFRQQIVDAGLIGVVLGLLNRCQGDKFEDVLSDLSGDLSCPSHWLNLLRNTTFTMPDARKLRDTRIQVAESLGPVASCFVDDIKREFFGDNKSWHAGMFPFIALLQNLVLEAATVPILRQYEGVSDIVVQTMFYTECRNDILEEAKQFSACMLDPDYSQIAASAGYVVQEFVDACGEGNGANPTEEEKERLRYLATTSTINTNYKKTSKTFAVGLVSLLERRSTVLRSQIYWILNMFAFGDCLDKEVIRGLVKYGQRSDINAEDAVEIPGTSWNLICPKPVPYGQQVPSDSRVAVAIDAGLLECLLAIARFDNSDMEIIEGIAQAVQAVSTQVKTKEALANKNRHTSVRQALDRFGRSQRVQRLVDSIRSIFRMSADLELANEVKHFCRKCGKYISPDNVKRCSKCKRATYCSRDCQVADWKNHKQDCASMTTTASQLKSEGRSSRDVKKVKEHEANVSILGNKVFYDNVNGILMRAIFQGQSIVECVVVIDLTRAPPEIEVQEGAVFLSDNLERAPHSYDHTRKVFERNRANGAITAACLSLGVDGIHDMAAMLKTIPHASGSWATVQDEMKSTMPSEIMSLSQEEKEAYIEKVGQMPAFGNGGGCVVQ